MEKHELLRGGQFLVKESHCNSVFYARRFFGRTGHDERSRKRIQ